MNKAFYFLAYAIWIFGLAFLVSIDYLLRLTKEDFYSLGMPEFIWYFLQLVLAAIAFFCLYIAIRPQSKSYIFTHFSIGLAFGLLFYIGLSWGYIIGTGVDSF